MPNVFLPPSRLTSFRILFLKPVTTIRNNLRPLKVFKHITSWSLDLYKVSTDLSLPVSMSAGNCFQDTRCPAVGNSHCTFTKIFLGICWVYAISISVETIKISSPKQCLKSLEFSKQLPDVITQIALCTITKNRFCHLRPPAWLRQTLHSTQSFVSAIIASLTWKLSILFAISNF